MTSSELLQPVDGWRPSFPQIELNEYVLERRGMPQVDFEGVEELLGKELGLSAAKYPKINLTGSPETVDNSQLARYKRIGGGLVEVDATAIQAGFSEAAQDSMLLEGVAHESRHHKDALEHPIRTRLENWAPADLSASASLVVTTIGGMPFFWSMVVTGGAFVAGKWSTLSPFYYNRNPYEQRAIEFASQPHIQQKYGSIIHFTH